MSSPSRRFSLHLNEARAAVRCTHAHRSKQYVLFTEMPDSIAVLKAGCHVVAQNDDELVVSAGRRPGPADWPVLYHGGSHRPLSLPARHLLSQVDH